MEVSLQPSFTFPSRKVYANRALGLQAQINLQQITSVPKNATDINLETSLFPTLTVPKSLDKESIDVPPVLPVTTPIYVQPGLAEGLTDVAATQQFEGMVLTTVSANNALKRGNYKAAENILGRPVTVEEIQNGSITPQPRYTENGEKVHVGNFSEAVGTQLRKGPSKQEQELAMRTLSTPFLNDLASQLGMTVEDLSRLKFENRYVGEIDFSSYGRSTHPEEKAATLRKFVDYLNLQGHKTKLQKEEEKQREWDSARANIFSGAFSTGAAEWRARQEAEYAKARADHAATQQEQANPGEHGFTFYDGGAYSSGRATAGWEQKNDTRGPSTSPLDDIKYPDHDTTMDDNVHPGVIDVTQNNIPLPFVSLTRLQNEPIGPDTKQLLALSRISVEHYKSSFNEEMYRRARLIIEEKAKMLETLKRGEARPDTEEVDMTNEDVAKAVLDAPKGMDQRHKEVGKRSMMEELTERIRKRRKSSHEDEDDEKMGEGFGKQNRRKKRKNIRFAVDDRWVPEAEGYFEKGAPISGRYMRKTGTDAMAISAQLQVPETHQWTELPVRTFTAFPNMKEETKTDLLPIAQNTDRGVGAYSGKVPFGKYKLDMSKLMGEGVMSMSHPNGRKVHGFPNRRVSKGVHHALSQLMMGGKVNPRKLAAEDKVFMTRLLHRSHANVPAIGADVNMPPEEQLQLILGEMSAGNDSDVLKGQLKKLLPYMCRMKMITPQHKAEITAHYLH